MFFVTTVAHPPLPGRAEGGIPARAAGYIRVKVREGAEPAILIESSPC